MNRVWYLIKLAEELGFNVSRLMGKSANVLPIKKPNLTKSGIKIETATDQALDNELTETINLARNNKLSGQELEQSIRNLENIKAARNAPQASVYDFAKKEQVSPEGIKTLIQEKGQIAKPGTPMGNVETRVKQLEAKAKEEGMTLDDVFKDVMETQKTASKLQDEGLVRAAVRYKMMDDVQKGILKVPKNLEDVIRGASNEEDVINIFRNNYGEAALEQVDSLVPDFYKMTSPTEAVKKIETTFPDIKPKKIKFPETVDIDKLPPPDEFAVGGRVGFADAGPVIDNNKFNLADMYEQDLQGDLKFYGQTDDFYLKNLQPFTMARLMKNLNRFVEEGGAPEKAVQYQKEIQKLIDRQASIYNKLPMEEKEKLLEKQKELYLKDKDILPGMELKNKKEEKEKFYDPFARERYDLKTGGISQGLDYLTGVERRGYANGTLLDRYNEILAEMQSGQEDLGALSPQILYNQSEGGSPTFTTPTKEESEATLTEGMTDVGENKFGGLAGLIRTGLGFAAGAINPALGMAFSLADPNSMTRQVLANIGFNPVTEGSINGPFGGYNNFTGTEGTFTTDTSDTGTTSQAASEASMSEGMSDLAEGGIARKKYEKGSKPPKEQITIPMNPMMDEGFDPSKRGFLKGAAAVGAGITALGTGALRLARKGAKKAKDLDIIFRKDYDGDMDFDGTTRAYVSIISDLVPHSKKAKNFLDDMVKQKKVIKHNDGSYFIDVQDIHDMGGDVGVFKDIKDKFDYKTFDTGYVKNKKGEWEFKNFEVDDLRSYDSPLINDAPYGPIRFEDDAAEYVADILQPKTPKEVIEERVQKIERELKQKGKFANGGLSYLQGL